MTRNFTNAWREILARVFEGFTSRRDVTPDWLVNPDTQRRLKLDVYYPDVDVAVRFLGLRGKERRSRLSLEEEEQQRQRDQARGKLCQAYGVSLVTIDVISGIPNLIFADLKMALSDASRRLAKSERPLEEKGALIENNSRARNRLNDIARRVRQIEDLQLYDDLWQDRQYAIAETAFDKPNTSVQSVSFVPGMMVQHVKFGDGIVESVQKNGDDTMITILFDDETQRIFSGNLVQGKLIPHP